MNWETFGVIVNHQQKSSSNMVVKIVVVRSGVTDPVDYSDGSNTDKVEKMLSAAIDEWTHKETFKVSLNTRPKKMTGDQTFDRHEKIFTVFEMSSQYMDHKISWLWSFWDEQWSIS